MSKGYTKQEVLEWQGWAEKRKVIGHIEYEVFLRNGSEEGQFDVDVRKDIVDSNNDIANGGEYIEGEIFDDYDKAKERFSQFVKEYLATGEQVGHNNEVEMDRMAEKEGKLFPVNQRKALYPNLVGKEVKLIERIRNICSTNVDVDWLENDASEEFARIVKLIQGEMNDEV
jgi:hypothetical protein